MCDINTLIETFTAGMIFGAILMFLGASIAISMTYRRGLWPRV
jgi:hypothetical protein